MSVKCYFLCLKCSARLTLSGGNVNTKYLLFQSVPGNIAQGQSTSQVYEVGAMHEDTIDGRDRENSFCCIYCPVWKK